MEITPRELRDVEIAEAFRGYNREVVNDLLERAATAIDAGNARVAEVTERLKSAQMEADRSRETEDILHRTLLLAQRAADEAVAEAQQKAREMMEEAELESHKLLADAQTEAQRRRDEERDRLENEVIDLAARRDTLLADVDALTQFESEYRARLSGVLENDIAMLRERPSASPGPVPEVHDVELPVAAEAIAPDAYAPETADGETAADASEESSEAVFDAPEDQGAELSPGEQPITNFFGAPAREVETATGPATREVDMTALFDADAPEPEPESAPAAFESPTSWAAAQLSETSGYASDQPYRADASTGTDDEYSNEPSIPDATFDMLRPDALDAEVLDDDAFFATLREAVHDDSPLGPRDEGTDEGAFYGDDDDRASFRDVFRRRR